MTLIRTGQGVTDIRGGFGGVYFTRDKSGLHCSAKPRRVAQGTPKQQKQRGCFSKARRYSKDERVVSYLIYRCLNDLPLQSYCDVTGNPDPDCTGKYILEGTYDGENYYKRKDSAWHLWGTYMVDFWFISDVLGAPVKYFWSHPQTIEGTYDPEGSSTGNPVVDETIIQVPPDYNPSKL